ncbi:MAG: enoyl-CoA hydratase [Planctomycetes bacterium]|nr:enoyl-CoA hydratase [Planctomycetota bacterium]MCP4837944.1 enoyl-CoA hydratase [Planctomycetota bacterium]
MSEPSHLLTEVDRHVAVIRINRPKVLNALNLELMQDLAALMEQYDADDSIRVILLAGSQRAWAAGADISDMATATRADMESRDQFAQWNRIKAIRKPIVAAVSGFALGGGCELMMHCDVVVCSENAKIGQPEINIGVMPGAGGTQRLTRAVGKAVAMDIVLSGRFLSAKEAMIFGLVSRVVPKEHWFDEAMNVAQTIATKAPISLRHAKESVLNADEIPLNDALGRERELFYMLFDTEDQSEGMSAFLEKRRPSFTGK